MNPTRISLSVPLDQARQSRDNQHLGCRGGKRSGDYGGALVGGALADRWRIKALALAPRVLLMIALFPVMSFLVANPTAATLVAAVAALSFLQAMSAAVGVIPIPLIFPPTVRSTGLAVAYSLGVAIFGGTATYVATWLVGVTGDPLASAYYVMAANVVMAVAVLLVPDADVGLRQWPLPVEREV